MFILAGLVLILSGWAAAQTAPVLNPIGPQSIDEGQTLLFGLSATDIDGDSLILSVVSEPANSALIDSGNGAGSFSFSPDFTQSSVYNVTFIASDGSLADSEVVAITVNNVNQAPVLASIGAKSTNENQLLTFEITSSDPDATTPTLTAVGLPAGASFNDSLDGTGGFSWTP
ncbi:MAG: cadherin-like domain-containing protein, partial [candidate division Zixibacteria bacterium]|nr:cadherin-like domain-containing protein [candidate division Zixibacteria bacterium]